MRRRLLVPLVAFVLVLAAACSDDGGDDAPPATQPTVTIELEPLDVRLLDPGATPRQELTQAINAGATWDGGLEFSLRVEGVASARAVGDALLEIQSVDDEGNATAHYTLDSLDVFLGTGDDGEPEQTTPDALTVSGEVVVGPDRSGTAANTARVAADGSVPGAEGLATSLDPRLVFLLLPFPDRPVGIGARWTISGPIPLFSTNVRLEAELELLARRGDHYTLGAAIDMQPDSESGAVLELSGLGRVEGDLNQLGQETGRFELTGTAVLPGRGTEPRPMTLSLEVTQRHSDAATATTS